MTKETKNRIENIFNKYEEYDRRRSIEILDLIDDNFHKIDDNISNLLNMTNMLGFDILLRVKSIEDFYYIAYDSNKKQAKTDNTITWGSIGVIKNGEFLNATLLNYPNFEISTDTKLYFIVCNSELYVLLTLAKTGSFIISIDDIDKRWYKLAFGIKYTRSIYNRVMNAVNNYRKKQQFICLGKYFDDNEDYTFLCYNKNIYKVGKSVIYVPLTDNEVSTKYPIQFIVLSLTNKLYVKYNSKLYEVYLPISTKNIKNIMNDIGVLNYIGMNTFEIMQKIVKPNEIIDLNGFSIDIKNKTFIYRPDWTQNNGTPVVKFDYKPVIFKDSIEKTLDYD